MGLTINLVESAFITRNHYLLACVTRALREHPEVENVRVLDISTALSHGSCKPCDILLVLGGEDANSYGIQQLRRDARTSVVWYLEDPYEINQNILSCKNFDLVFTNDSWSAVQYGPRAHHLPLGAELSYTDSFLPFKKRLYDISFIGTAWPNRAHLIKESYSSLSLLKTKILLVENAYIQNELKRIQIPIPLTSGVDYEDYMRINQQSRLSLMIDREFSGSGANSTSDTPGPRFFEAGAAGACLITDTRVAGSTLEQLGFRDTEDYFSFTSAPTLVNLISEFRRDPAPFERAAESLQAKIRRSHTYANRLDTIIRISKEQLTQDKAPPISIQLSDSTHRPRILALTHNIAQFGGFGGAELYLNTLVQKSKDFDIYTLAHDGRTSFGSRYVLLDNNGSTIAELTPALPVSSLALTDPELERFFIKCCEKVKPRAILVNHLLGLTPTLPLIAKQIGLPYIVILHDYFTVCDEFNLLTPQGFYCNIRTPDAELCNLCTYRRRGIRNEGQLQRRNFYGRVLANAFSVVSNTSLSAQITERISGVPLPNKKVIPPPRIHRIEDLPPRSENDKKQIVERIAVLGNMSPNKGMMDFLEIAKSLKTKPVTFDVFGRTDHKFAIELNRYGLSNVRIHGPYKPGKLPEALADCQVALFLSRWPETYCMSLTEVIDSGIVPIGYDIGAVGERITDDIGFKTAINPFEVSHILDNLIERPDEFLRKRRNLEMLTPNRDDFHEAFESLFADASFISHGVGNALSSGARRDHLCLDLAPANWDQSIKWDDQQTPSIPSRKVSFAKQLKRKIKSIKRRITSRK